MDTVSIGNMISRLRKKSGMTQLQLAEKLHVSDKAISKWESGQGYPDITAFPKLASIFGVTIDYLMLGEKKGIAIAGNIIVDVVKNIDFYPEVGMLANVNSLSYAVGGAVSNTGISLARMDRSIPIYAMGRVGNDENGKFVTSIIGKNGVNTDGIVVSSNFPTSTSDVMSEPSAERTFFHNKGANAEFSPEDIDLDALNCNIFHIGYILLLDVFDKEDKKYGTVMASLLHKLQERGIKTSIDVVSSSDKEAYSKKIIPALKYSNYAIMNEIECCTIWNLNPRYEDGKINKENIKLAMKKMIECGVKDKIVVHSKEISFAMDVKTGEFTEVASLKIPSSEIMGSVGAGDAFCAGCLYALYNDFSDKEMLEYASAAAACNLFAANSIDGMRSKNEIYKVASKYERLDV